MKNKLTLLGLIISPFLLIFLSVKAIELTQSSRHEPTKAEVDAYYADAEEARREVFEEISTAIEESKQIMRQVQQWQQEDAKERGVK